MNEKQLSHEQQTFINYALAGHNILVEACIGSGKTTAIQALCNAFRGKRILYLTYNKLLKLDAKARIRNGFVTVTNYHGFAYQELQRNQIKAGISDLIQVYNRADLPVFAYDVLILDEYQDIDQEIADMLWHIKKKRPNIQIVAVGDMCQKIYDKTTLDVRVFIRDFLGTYIPMEFTQCFRLGKEHAAMLGRVWEKTIVGVNPDFQLTIASEYEAMRIAKETKPEDLLVLGSRGFGATKLQNYLETKCPKTFNKHTLWSKISDSEGGSTSPTPDCAVFTTYDGCKGMERKVCILYDFNANYWMTRSEKPNVQYEILRNLFCVAASRGKDHLVIVDQGNLMDEDLLKEPFYSTNNYETMQISDMFSFKRKEDVEAAYDALQVKTVDKPGDAIDIPTSDALIDLSPCVGMYTEAMYFTNNNLDASIEYQLSNPAKSHLRKKYQNYDLNQKLLYLAMLETGQNRYMNQVRRIEITPEADAFLKKRLSKYLSPDEIVQVPSEMTVFKKGENRPLFWVRGMSDVTKEDVIWELKFVNTLSHEHILQLAMYMIAQKKDTGYLWNLRTGERLGVTIPDREIFLNKVGFCVTRGTYPKTDWQERTLLE